MSDAQAEMGGVSAVCFDFGHGAGPPQSPLPEEVILVTSNQKSSKVDNQRNLQLPKNLGVLLVTTVPDVFLFCQPYNQP